MPVSQAQLGYGALFQREIDGAPGTWATVTETVKLGGPVMKMDMKEVTEMLSPNTFKEFIAGLRDGGQVTFELNYLPKDAVQTKLITDFQLGTNKKWQIVLPGSLGTWSFSGFVSDLSPAIPIDDRATVTGTIKITGMPTLA
jgi:hypothetical protein